MVDWNYDSEILIKALGGISKNRKKVVIKTASTADRPLNNSIIFFTASKWKDEFQNRLDEIKDSFIIVEPSIYEKFLDISIYNCVVMSENARLYFAKALKIIIEGKNNKREYKSYGLNCVIGENVEIGKNCLIEPFVFIDHDVKIGNNVTIKSGAKIRQNVILENSVVIGENSVVGAQGFGIEKDVKKGNIRIPHIGGVIVKEGSEIGALTSIVSGTIYPTVVEKNVFIDDLNHIAHNCYIGEGTLTTAAVEIGGSAKIGKNGYIAPNVTVRNGISIGDNCFIGQASSVQKSFGDDVSLVGNPAKLFEYKK